MCSHIIKFCLAWILLSGIVKSAISGKIIDADSMEPLEGVNVSLLSTEFATHSDAYGNFILNVNSGLTKCDLKIDYIGYHTIIIRNVQIPGEVNLQLEIRLSQRPGIYVSDLILEYDSTITMYGSKSELKTARPSTPPNIRLFEPTSGNTISLDNENNLVFTCNKDTVLISGIISAETTIATTTLNGTNVVINSEGKFSTRKALQNGNNSFVIIAIDREGQVVTRKFVIAKE